MLATAPVVARPKAGSVRSGLPAVNAAAHAGPENHCPSWYGVSAPTRATYSARSPAHCSHTTCASAPSGVAGNDPIVSFPSDGDAGPGDAPAAATCSAATCGALPQPAASAHTASAAIPRPASARGILTPMDPLAFPGARK